MKGSNSLALAIFLSVCSALNFACAPPAANNTNVAQTTPTPAAAPATTAVADGDWPGYNRTLDGQRYSPLNQITTENVAGLKQVCVADLGEGGNYQSGIVVANNMLFATTETGTYAYDPATCQQKWKHTIEKPAAEGLRVNRGVAYADGKFSVA